MRVMNPVSGWLYSPSQDAPTGGLTRGWGRPGLFLMVLVVALVLAVLFPVPVKAQSRIFVPMVMGNAQPIGGSGEASIECGLNEQEQAILASMTLHPDQRRAELVCDAILSLVARARAKDMALRDYFSHTNPDGLGPNSLVRQAGYRLPSWYPSKADANNIESIAAGYRTPAAAWQGWMSSSGHRTHLLGTHNFYAGQTAVGVGYFYLAGSRYGHYWVVLSAHPEENISVQDIPE
jgi:uncharacterized protein YkwD